MRIGGFQKLTLLDFPNQMACIVFTPGCNFRCPLLPQCRTGPPARGCRGRLPGGGTSLPGKNAAGCWRGVVITGGEPLLQPDLRASKRSAAWDISSSWTPTAASLNGWKICCAPASWIISPWTQTPGRLLQSRGYRRRPAAAPDRKKRLPPDARQKHLMNSAPPLVKGAPYARRRGCESLMDRRGFPYFLQSYADSGDIPPGGLDAFF